MSKLRIFALAAALLLSVAALAPTTATAKNMSDVLISAPDHGKLQSFSKPEYYIRAGGTPPSIEALAANPKSFFRHDAAYTVFKRGFEVQMGRKLGDSALKRLLGSTKVELRDCVGSIHTTGVDRAGDVAWFTRACAKGEQLLWLTVGNKKVVVASMGCLNLVNAPIVSKPPAPVVMSGGGFTPPSTPPACTGEGCNPPPPPCEGKKCNPPPVCTTKCEPPPVCKGKDCKPEEPKKPKGNNGWGNGDQDPPGKSGGNNNAENNTSGKSDPSHGGNAGGQGGDKGNGGNNGNQGDNNKSDQGDNGQGGDKGKGKEK